MAGPGRRPMITGWPGSVGGSRPISAGRTVLGKRRTCGGEGAFTIRLELARRW